MTSFICLGVLLNISSQRKMECLINEVKYVLKEIKNRRCTTRK